MTRRFCLALLFLVAIPLTAQVCPPLTPSPVPSFSPDDIPPGENAWFINYTGTMFQGKPNHQIAYMATTGDEQKVWFSMDAHIEATVGDKYFVYYNRRYRASSTSPWYWEFALSKPTNLTAFADAVLYSPTPKYKDAAGVAHSYIMYLVHQPHACDGQTGGVAMVSFSDNGTCWSAMTPLRRTGGPSHACVPELGSNLMLVEAISPIDSGTKIYLMAMEGDVALLAPPENMNQTFASWYTSEYTTATAAQRPLHYTVNVQGVVNPLGDPYYLPYTPNDPARFMPYAYFFNLTTAYDPTNGYLYVTRAYPYPYDRRATYNPTYTPSMAQRQVTFLWNSYAGARQNVQGCAESPATYPNRYQVYRMYIWSPDNFEFVNWKTWELVSDNGGSVGYENLNGSPVPLTHPSQTAGTRDAGAATLFRTKSGNLVRSNGSAFVFAGSSLRENLSAGPCRTTGNERVVLTPLP